MYGRKTRKGASRIACTLMVVDQNDNWLQLIVGWQLAGR
jgi:hypothetical protein